ncbi:hypothetical protein BH11PLA2_BH11PLA2_30100 [soil metagenome]
MKIGAHAFLEAIIDTIVGFFYIVSLIAIFITAPLFGFVAALLGSYYLIIPEEFTAWDGSRWLKHGYTGMIIFFLGCIGGLLGLLAGGMIMYRLERFYDRITAKPSPQANPTVAA